jgi:hypothetical protein
VCLLDTSPKKQKQKTHKEEKERIHEHILVLSHASPTSFAAFDGSRSHGCSTGDMLYEWQIRKKEKRTSKRKEQKCVRAFVCSM